MDGCVSNVNYFIIVNDRPSCKMIPLEALGMETHSLIPFHISLVAEFLSRLLTYGSQKGLYQGFYFILFFIFK